MHLPIKTNVVQHKINKKLKPGLEASYNIRPVNRDGLFWLQGFINLSLTYLFRHLPLYLQPGTHTVRPAGGYTTNSEMHGWCDIRPMVTFPAAQHCHCPLAGTHFPSH